MSSASARGRPSPHPPPAPAAATAAACESLLAASAHALFAANRLPSPTSLALATAIRPDLRGLAASVAARSVALAAGVAKRYAAPASPFEADSDDGEPPAPEAVFDGVVEAVDAALDSANAALDKAAGIQDAVAPSGVAAAPQKFGGKGGGGRRRGRQCVALDMLKPQLGFPDYPIDNSDAPFVPLPPYGQEEEVGAVSAVDAHLRTLARNNAVLAAAPHPFEDEIAAAAAAAAGTVGGAPECVLFRPLDPPELSVIESEEELFEAAQRMQAAPAVAVDVEHHSVRSFQGLVCLLQVSTREEDFVIDAIKLRGSIRRALAPVFADERIVKVMHGAEHDVQWLERDFGIYIVNLFDTGRAAKLLGYSSLSLAFLLQRFADVDVSLKREFQTADWRQRPLPPAMVDYARSDTHYLLYIWDRLRCELHEKSLLAQAWLLSADICRIRYAKDRYDPEGSLRLAAKYGLCYDPRQMRMLAEVCRWRDATAREEDESVPYVMPNRVMFALVRGRTKARTAESLLNGALKGVQVPPLVRSNAETLARLVSDALDAKVPHCAIVETKPAHVKALTVTPATITDVVFAEQEQHLLPSPSLPAAYVVSPKPAARGARASVFFDSSSDEDEDKLSVSDPLPIAAPAAGQKSVFELDSDDDDDVGIPVMAPPAKPGPAALLSDGSGSDNERPAKNRNNVVQQIMESFVLNGLKAPDSFSGPVGAEALSEQPGAAEENMLDAYAQSDAEAMDEKEETFISLRDQHASLAPPRKRKRREKSKEAWNTSAAEAETAAVVAPFDYAADRRAREQSKQARHRPGEEAVYDPFGAFLHKTSSEVKRVKRVRKNPKSGERSMSFRAK